MKTERGQAGLSPLWLLSLAFVGGALVGCPVRREAAPTMIPSEVVSVRDRTVPKPIEIPSIETVRSGNFSRTFAWNFTSPSRWEAYARFVRAELRPDFVEEPGGALRLRFRKSLPGDTLCLNIEASNSKRASAIRVTLEASSN